MPVGLVAVKIINTISPSTQSTNLSRGEILYKGRDVLKMNNKQLCFRWNNPVLLFFKSAMNSLNLSFTIGEQLTDVILSAEKYLKQAHDRAVRLVGAIWDSWRRRCRALSAEWRYASASCYCDCWRWASRHRG
ncbi:hypothetical protein OK016_02330 [Vibrio chagasii]|nr:hypothetical protein [Vibrio chagasii]